MNGFLQWLQQLNLDSVYSTLLIVLASLLCITVHESCHGLVAYWLGDPTAKRAGRLTLNPIKHIDPVGLVMMAVFKFGWAKPVPVDMRYFKNPKKGMALTALAGPASNVLLAYGMLLVRSVLVFFFTTNMSRTLATAITFTEYTALISTGLAIFNLIPVSPLDGSKILMAFLPQKAYATLMQYERYGMLLVMALLFVGVFDKPLILLRSGLMSILMEFSAFPFTLLQHMFG